MQVHGAPLDITSMRAVNKVNRNAQGLPLGRDFRFTIRDKSWDTNPTFI